MWATEVDGVDEEEHGDGAIAGTAVGGAAADGHYERGAGDVGW